MECSFSLTKATWQGTAKLIEFNSVKVGASEKVMAQYKSQIVRDHDRSDLFTTWTLKFFPAFPLVESTDDEARVYSVLQRSLEDMDWQATSVLRTAWWW